MIAAIKLTPQIPTVTNRATDVEYSDARIGLTTSFVT